MATTTDSDELESRRKRSAPKSPVSRGSKGRAHGTVARTDPVQAGLAAYVSAEKAYALRMQGKSLSEIAEILEIPNYLDVDRLLAERYKHEAAFLSDTQRKSLLALETARLDALQDAVWPAAMMGDPKSVDSCVKIIMARARITGLEQVDPVINKNLVLVMGEKEEDYINALKAAGAGQDD